MKIIKKMLLPVMLASLLLGVISQVASATVEEQTTKFVRTGKGGPYVNDPASWFTLGGGADINYYTCRINGIIQTRWRDNPPDPGWFRKTKANAECEDLPAGSQMFLTVGIAFGPNTLFPIQSQTGAVNTTTCSVRSPSEPWRMPCPFDEPINSFFEYNELLISSHPEQIVKGTPGWPPQYQSVQTGVWVSWSLLIVWNSTDAKYYCGYGGPIVPYNTYQEAYNACTAKLAVCTDTGLAYQGDYETEQGAWSILLLSDWQIRHGADTSQFQWALSTMQVDTSRVNANLPPAANIGRLVTTVDIRSLSGDFGLLGLGHGRGIGNDPDMTSDAAGVTYTGDHIYELLGADSTTWAFPTFGYFSLRSQDYFDPNRQYNMDMPILKLEWQYVESGLTKRILIWMGQQDPA